MKFITFFSINDSLKMFYILYELLGMYKLLKIVITMKKQI